MTIMQLLTPITKVHWLAASDTVGDALDHMEAYDVRAIPMLDADGDHRYLGTVTLADLRRHLSHARDRAAAMATELSAIARRAENAPVTAERDVESLAAQAAANPFVPVVDKRGRLLGVIDSPRIPHAA